MHHWHIVTGEYPPQPGGVSDYTRLVARGLAAAGDSVQVWAPAVHGLGPDDLGVSVCRLPGHFGWRALRRLSGVLGRQRRPFHVLVQYVPHMYGWKAMNLLFTLWLAWGCPAPWVMFHEVAFPIARGQSALHNVLGVVTHLMAAVAARASRRTFVSVPRWAGLLQRLAPGRGPFLWLPIPSNFATTADPVEATTVRARVASGPEVRLVGHFGTLNRWLIEQLAGVLAMLLPGNRHWSALLIGRDSAEGANQIARLHPSLANQVHASGSLSAEGVTAHLKACDLLVQPYPDGVSSRRSSVMAGLALGQPIVTTFGPATESVWGAEELVVGVPPGDPRALANALATLADDPDARQRLAARARAGYHAHFSLERTITTLRAWASQPGRR